MKKTLLALLIIFIALHSRAQNFSITFKTLSSASDKFKIALPVAGTYFPIYQELKLIDSADLTISNNLSKAGLIDVYYGKSFSFYIEPRKSYTITLEPGNREHPFSFKGDNAEGQYLLNQIKHGDYMDKADAFIATYPTYDKIGAAIDSTILSEQQRYDVLLNDKAINATFYNYVKADREYYYAAVMSAIINVKNNDVTFTSKWEDLFKARSLTNAEVTSLKSFQDYADEYANTYKTSYHRKVTNTIKRFNIKLSNDYLIDWHNRYADNLPEPAREYVIARFLNRFISMKKYEPELLDLYNAFKQRYPSSKFIPVLKPGVDDIIAFQEKVKAVAQAEQKIVDNYAAINTLDELLALYKNKVVFIDIWATWCSPCKQEFAYNKPLHKFLKEKNVQMLYLSTDVPERDKEWRDMIKFFDLKGDNIRTSDKLRQDLIKVLWGGKGYAIPRYVIIKNGQIVVNDAERPSSTQKLYDQIAQYL